MAVFLSIIIPAYNEEKRIVRTLKSIHKYIIRKQCSCEVIVVDDGSCDNTILRARESSLFKEGLLKVVKNRRNYGKGRSVKRGINKSKGQYVLFSDADLSTPIRETDKLIKGLDEGYDIAIGSRSVKGSKIRYPQPWYRILMGKVFNVFVKLFVFRGIDDTQCGFKLFDGKIARKICRRMSISGFAFDVEMLYIAKKRGYRVKETGVIWKNSPESKVRLLSSPLSMFIDLFRISLRGSYYGA